MGAWCLERVPVEPFQRFLRERIEHYERELVEPWERDRQARCKNTTSGAVAAVCREIGWLEGDKPVEHATRKFYRYRHALESAKAKDAAGVFRGYERPAESFRRDIVEEAFHYAGFNFYEYYPEFEQHGIYPEYHCIDCEETGPHEHVNGGWFCIWCLGRAEYKAKEEARRKKGRARLAQAA